MYMYISLQKDIPITQDRSLQMKTIVIPSAEEETPLKFLHRRGGIKSIEFFFFFGQVKICVILTITSLIRLIT